MNEKESDEKILKNSIPEKSPQEWEAEMSKQIDERLNNLSDNNSELMALLEETSQQKKTIPETESEIPQSDIYSPDEKLNNLSDDINEILELLEETSRQKKTIPETEREVPQNNMPSPDLHEELPPLKPLKKVSQTPPPVIHEEIPEPVNNPVKNKKRKKKRKTFKQSFLALFPQKDDSTLEKCRKIIYMISVITIIVCGTIVLDYYIDTTTTQNEYENIIEDYQPPEATEPVTEPEPDAPVRQYTMMSDAKKLYDINPDIVGVISIPDTDVFYPVVKGRDNQEYLNKTVTGEEARAGSIFIDYRNMFDEVKDGVMQSSDNIIIYGHEMATGKMFGSLKMYKDNTYYYEEHPIIEFNSNYFCYKYKIFSIMIVDADDRTDTRYEYWNALDFDDEKEFYSFVNEAKKRNIRLNDVDVKYGDPLITLSTCNEIFGKDREGRLVIMARRLREGEDPLAGTQNSSTNHNVKWPSVYYEYNSVQKFREEDFVPYG